MPLFTKKPPRQLSNGPPIIEDPRLPKMVSEPSERVAKARGRRMSDQPRGDKGGKNRMKPVPRIPRTHEMVAEFRDQISAKPARIAKRQQDSYLRLHFRVENSQILLVDVHEVEGPLAMPRDLHGDIAYEIMLGTKRVGVGSVADIGVIRGFPRPDADPAKEGHSIIELPSYDFHARVPKKELSLSSLPKIQVSVFRIKALPTKTIDGRPLALQFGNNLREAAKLEGIQLNKLPPKLRLKLRNIVGRKDIVHRSHSSR